jgi:hypothetical protein
LSDYRILWPDKRHLRDGRRTTAPQSIANGDLKSDRDQMLVEDIDLRGGVDIAIQWDE